MYETVLDGFRFRRAEATTRLADIYEKGDIVVKDIEKSERLKTAGDSIPKKR